MPPRERRVRRVSTWSRLTAFLNPIDYLLSIATDIDAYDWDSLQTTLGTPLGLVLNFLCLIARSNSNRRRSSADDIFARPPRSSWTSGLPYFLWALSWALVAVSVVNAVYCFSRKKRYRLFESNLEIPPATPSASIVRVEPESVSSSPRALLNTLAASLGTSPSSRAHPDPSLDVWEIAVWDPTPLSLRLFALFSPAHVAVYFLSLPLTSTSGYGYTYQPASPSTSPAAVVLTALTTQLLITLQLLYVQASYLRQAKDNAIIHKEVLHEYDTKYVHPRLNTIRRDVAVQCDPDPDLSTANVYTPQFNRRAFRTAASGSSYADLTVERPPGRRESAFDGSSTPAFRTPYVSSHAQTQSHSRGTTPAPAWENLRMRQPDFNPPPSTASSSNVRRSTSMGTGLELQRSSSTYSSDATPVRPRGRDRDSAVGTSADAGVGPGTAAGMGYYPGGMNGVLRHTQEMTNRLSPSKARSSTPLRSGGGRVWASSYAGSLNTPGLGTPRRKRTEREREREL